ncbi:MAG: hypothetical protein IJT45_06610, partial [Bacteroidales bacterium]|nr:hypothetical protein [Bacteroidales bacterium]
KHDCGQPPRHIRKAIFSKSNKLFCGSMGLFSNKSLKLILPDDSPDSHKLIGRMLIRHKYYK